MECYYVNFEPLRYASICPILQPQYKTVTALLCTTEWAVLLSNTARLSVASVAGAGRGGGRCWTCQELAGPGDPDSKIRRFEIGPIRARSMDLELSGPTVRTVGVWSEFLNVTVSRSCDGAKKINKIHFFMRKENGT